MVVSVGVICAMAHRDAVNEADSRFESVAPVHAAFSRFRVSSNHTLSIYWKLRFARARSQLPGVAIWHLRPFGAVEFAK